MVVADRRRLEMLLPSPSHCFLPSSFCPPAHFVQNVDDELRQLYQLPDNFSSTGYLWKLILCSLFCWGMFFSAASQQQILHPRLIYSDARLTVIKREKTNFFFREKDSSRFISFETKHWFRFKVHYSIKTKGVQLPHKVWSPPLPSRLVRAASQGTAEASDR